MKKNIIITLAIIITAAFSVNAQKSMDKFQVQVDGLGCPFCAYGLEKKFKEFKGIKAVKIDIETGDFTFDYPAEKALTLQAVEKQVEKAGYTPITLKIERANGEVETSEEAVVSTGDLKNMATKEIKVAGNCAMCEARIVKAVKGVSGVGEVSWDKDTKLMNVSFAAPATMNDIESAVSKAGHDTKNSKANDDTYKSLPACCHYDRLSY